MLAEATCVPSGIHANAVTSPEWPLLARIGCRDSIYHVRLGDGPTSGAFSRIGCDPEADVINTVPTTDSRSQRKKMIH